MSAIVKGGGYRSADITGRAGDEDSHGPALYSEDVSSDRSDVGGHHLFTTEGRADVR